MGWDCLSPLVPGEAPWSLDVTAWLGSPLSHLGHLLPHEAKSQTLETLGLPALPGALHLPSLSPESSHHITRVMDTVLPCSGARVGQTVLSSERSHQGAPQKLSIFEVSQVYLVRTHPE